MKWVELAGKSSTAHMAALSDFLNRHGHANQVEFCEVDEAGFEEALKETMAKYDAIKIGSPFRKKVVSYFDHQSSIMNLVRAADSLVKVNESWWPRASTYYGFQKMLARVGAHIDLDAGVLVVGAGAGACFVIAALAKLGFKTINITNKDEEQAEALIKEVRRIFFGVNFRFIPQDRLVLLPGNNSIVVNTTPLAPSNDLLQELYYYNFLQANGVAIDFTLDPIETPFIKEGLEIGISVVYGYEVASEADIVWAQWMTGKNLPGEEYTAQLKKCLESKTSV